MRIISDNKIVPSSAESYLHSIGKKSTDFIQYGVHASSIVEIEDLGSAYISKEPQKNLKNKIYAKLPAQTFVVCNGIYTTHFNHSKYYFYTGKEFQGTALIPKTGDETIDLMPFPLREESWWKVISKFREDLKEVKYKKSELDEDYVLIQLTSGKFCEYLCSGLDLIETNRSDDVIPGYSDARRYDFKKIR